ncbi:cell division protein FtsQ/DivIB [Sporosarcina sp. FSL K6-1508]|uniref:cell division protein FtsQ/DivIB n=1 Tax=Sporosarcina sp. FSL K6-1508 TaxID=2921553 RepID=UPI0030F99BB4
MDKVIDIEERIPSMRERRRRKTNKKFLFMLTVFVIALLAILYFQSPLSKLEAIKVSGAVLHEPAFYEEQSGLTVDNSLWSFSTEDIEESLGKIEGVKKVSVSRKWFRDIEIEITEWKTVAYLEDGGQYSLLLESGEMFPTTMLSPEAESPVLNNFKNPDTRKRITKQLLKLDESVYHLISEIIVMGEEDDSDSITVYMDDGYEVRAFISTFAENMTYYPDITAQLNGNEKGVIDMEVGAFFTPFSKVYGGIEEEDPIGEEGE